MKTLSAYCTAVLLVFGVATHEGYAVSSLFGNHHHQEPGQGGGTVYHK
jgi:hypothetical protein